MYFVVDAVREAAKAIKRRCYSYISATESVRETAKKKKRRYCNYILERDTVIETTKGKIAAISIFL